jgi:hypothetical protein
MGIPWESALSHKTRRLKKYTDEHSGLHKDLLACVAGKSGLWRAIAFWKIFSPFLEVSYLGQ